MQNDIPRLGHRYKVVQGLPRCSAKYRIEARIGSARFSPKEERRMNREQVLVTLSQHVLAMKTHILAKEMQVPDNIVRACLSRLKTKEQ